MGPPAVNKPVDEAQKEQDINRKLQLYGILTAFQVGKVPSNDQIDVALNSFLATGPIANPPEKLSPEGRELVAAVRDVIDRAKHLVLSKNEGNLLQEFVWQTQQFDPSVVTAPGAPVDKDTAKKHGDDALGGLRTLGTLIITNGQFRKLLSDSVILLRDIAGDAATSAASRVKPSDGDLAQIDHPAGDNVWHDAPDLSADAVKRKLQDTRKRGEETKQSATDAATDAASSQPANGAAASSSAQAAKDQVVPPETQEAARKRTQEYRDRAREYLDKKVPRERRQQTVWRLKKMILECQQHPDYQQAIETLLSLAEEYGRHAGNVSKAGAGSAKDTRAALATAESDLKTLIERFANGTSTEDLWNSFRVLYDDAQKDPELRQWFTDIDKYIRRCLQEQGYILEDVSTRDWDALYDRGNFLLREKYRGHTDRVIDEFRFLFEQFDQDAQNRAFAASLRRLFRRLGMDDAGSLAFKPHLIKDITEVILPAVFENVAYVPIPRIEYSDDQVEAIVENLVLESDNFMPNLLEIANENFFRWGRKTDKGKSRENHSLAVHVRGVQMDLRNVAFYIRRKQGFPAITDKGVANILLAGDGLSFNLKMSTANRKNGGDQKILKVDKVDVDIKNLKIKLVSSSHKLLFGLARPFVLRALRPTIKRAAEKAIRDYATRADELISRIKEEADHALADAQREAEAATDETVDGVSGMTSPDQARAKMPSVYSRWSAAAQKVLADNKKRAAQLADEAKARAPETDPSKKLNVAITADKLLFPDIKLPGGVTTKATEYRDLARKGDRWESPVFSIGAASRSTDVQPAPQVVRKPHDTRRDTGKQNGLFAGGVAPSTQTGSGSYPNNSGTYPGGVFNSAQAGSGTGYVAGGGLAAARSA